MREVKFTRKEFACECGCGFDAMDFYLINMLEDSRDYFTKKYDAKVKVEITGGNRCKAHNEEVQKKYVKNYVPFSSNSEHLNAKAADHKHYYLKFDKWVQISAQEVYDYYDKHHSVSGLGIYHNRVHIDSRSHKSRWRG